jgi:drug/metabolite transporter (DMT)-like permease
MRRGYAALALLALIWGASFLFIKVAVQDMSPAMMVLLRAAAGFLTLALILAVRGQTPFPAGTRRRLLPFVILAVFGSALPWFGFGFGELSISSALASILNATTPLWTAVFAYWVTPAERPSGLNYVGVAIGFVGTGILIAPDLVGHTLRATTLGTLAVAGAAACYAVAALVQRRRLRGVSPLQVGFWQLAITVPLAFVVALPTIGATHLRPAALLSIIALGAGGSGIAYLLYYYMMNTLGATRATTVTFLLPLTAVFWGATLLQEAITIPILVGMTVILLGVFLTSRPRSRRVTAVAAMAVTLTACSMPFQSVAATPSPTATPTPSPTPTPIPSPTTVNGRIVVSSLDDNGAAVVAAILYPPSGGSCSVSGKYDSCPVTDGLAARLDANPLKQAEPLCRCQNTYQSRTIITEPLPPGNPGAIAHVVLDFGGGTTIKLDVTVIRSQSSWFASDTSCSGQDATATSIYAASPPPCG